MKTNNKKKFYGLYRMPLVWKMGLIGLVTLGSVLGIIHWSVQLPYNVGSDVVVLPISYHSLTQLYVKMLMGIASVIVVVFGWLFIDINSTKRKIQDKIRESLEERNLDQELKDLVQGATTESLSHSIEHVLHLYKAFDHMKTTRCYTEINTLKTIMNNLKEGVVIIDENQTVVSINHAAEQLLRLIPGEVEGLSLSRKINSASLLESVEVAIEKGEKVIEKRIALPERKKIQVTLLPVTDKKNHVVRAVMVVTPSTTRQKKPV